jgi:predicted DCC family thiol-disulfide oxidoreductase YuxK
MQRERLVIYDGYCNLCSRTVQWVVRNDPRERFTFRPFGKEEGGSDTVLLTENGKQYNRSTAVLRIAMGLRFPWPLLGALLSVPRFLRDPLYNLVARNRKRWFGTRDSCYLPPR